MAASCLAPLILSTAVAAAVKLPAPACGRRVALAGLAGVGACCALPRIATADADTAAVSAAVTDKVRLEFVQQINAEESRTLALTVGLFGKDAPASVAAFKAAAAGTLSVPCKELTTEELAQEMTDRGRLSKKKAYTLCEGSESLPVTLAYSQIWAIQRGVRVDCGAVEGKFALRVAPTTPADESAGLSHDSAGLLSVRRGGGAFDFGLTTGASPAYDEDYAVIGRVLDAESMAALAELDALPVVKAPEVLGVEASKASREKACSYGSANSYCNQNKPLKKVTLLRSAVL